MPYIKCRECGKYFKESKNTFIGLFPKCTFYCKWFLNVARCCIKDCKKCKIKIVCKKVMDYYKKIYPPK